jgi:hypothetical protein
MSQGKLFRVSLAKNDRKAILSVSQGLFPELDWMARFFLGGILIIYYYDELQFIYINNLLILIKKGIEKIVNR